MVPLSVSLFRLRFANFPVSVLIFRIVLVMSHEDTAGNLLDFLTHKILIELPLHEFRPMGKSISVILRHPPNTSEHPSHDYRPVGAFSKSSRPYRSMVSGCPTVDIYTWSRPRGDMVGAVSGSPGPWDCRGLVV